MTPGLETVLAEVEPLLDGAPAHQPWIVERLLESLIIERRIIERAEDGKVAVIESGRDCDCVEYSGRVHIIDATVEAFIWLDSQIGDWADGPYRLGIVKPSEAKTVEYTSRDLVLEAMEDGHRQVIYSQFP